MGPRVSLCLRTVQSSAPRTVNLFLLIDILSSAAELCFKFKCGAGLDAKKILISANLSQTTCHSDSDSDSVTDDAVKLAANGGMLGVILEVHLFFYSFGSSTLFDGGAGTVSPKAELISWSEKLMTSRVL